MELYILWTYSQKISRDGVWAKCLSSERPKLETSRYKAVIGAIVVVELLFSGDGTSSKHNDMRKSCARVPHVTIREGADAPPQRLMARDKIDGTYRIGPTT